LLKKAIVGRDKFPPLWATRLINNRAGHSALPYVGIGVAQTGTPVHPYPLPFTGGSSTLQGESPRPIRKQKTLTGVSEVSDVSDLSEGCFKNFFHLH